jgi:hypothetical protein
MRAVAFLLVLVAVPPSVRAERNNGTDPTRPRTQLLTLYDFVNLPGPAPDSSNTFTFRAIQKLALDDHWSGSLRVDVPLVLTNAESADNPDGRFVFGSGNLLTQVAAIYTPNERWAFAAGSEVTFPTASRETTGSATYTALPGAVFRCMLPELSAGSFVAPEMLYAFDVGGDPDGSHVSELQLQPTLDWELPRGVFLQLFPSSDIRINLGKPQGSGRLFFPFDVLAGIMVTPRLLASLEASIPIVKDYPVYDFKLEATVGYFFD